jgi:hypothetical protein
MVLFLCLKPDGEVREEEKNINSKFELGETLSLQYLKGVVDNKGKGKIQQLHVWEFGGNQIYIYGWCSGNADVLSNHSLPSPLHDKKFYGDLICFLVSDNQLIDFSEGYYLDFFQNNWEEEPAYEEDEDEEDSVSENEEVDVDEELENNDDNAEMNTIEIILTDTYDELQLEPEYFEI